MKYRTVKQSLCDWQVIGSDGKPLGWITRMPNRGYYFVQPAGCSFKIPFLYHREAVGYLTAKLGPSK